MSNPNNGSWSSFSVVPRRAAKVRDTKRQRKFTPRVRSGCDVCKQRKLKCDEQKPSCERCQKAGFACDYKNVPQARHFISRSVNSTISPPPISAPMISWHQGNGEELRSIAFYLQRMAPILSMGARARDFWSVVIPQASWTYPEVKHMVVAISSLGQDLNSARFSPSTQGDFQPALSHYHRALTMLSRRPVSVDCGLLTCVLAVVFENIAGNYQIGEMHMKAAMRITEEAKAKNEIQHLRLPPEGVEAICTRARTSSSTDTLEPTYTLSTMEQTRAKLDEVIQSLQKHFSDHDWTIEQGLPSLICWRKAFERFRYKNPERMLEKRHVFLHHNILMTYLYFVQNSGTDQELQESQWSCTLNDIEQLIEFEQIEELRPGILIILDFILKYCSETKTHYKRAVRLKADITTETPTNKEYHPPYFS